MAFVESVVFFENQIETLNLLNSLNVRLLTSLQIKQNVVNIKCVKKSIYHVYEERIEKFVSRDHCSASLGKPRNAEQ